MWREMERGGGREVEVWRCGGKGSRGKGRREGEGTVTHSTKPIDMFTVNRFSVTNYSRGEKPSTYKQYILMSIAMVTRG